MGFELDRLLKQYGVANPTLGLAPSMPGAPVAPTPPGASATDAEKQAYNTALADYTARKAAYDTALPDLQAKYGIDKTTYDTYTQDYKNRLSNTSMYNQPQFQNRIVPTFVHNTGSQPSEPSTPTPPVLPGVREPEIRIPETNLNPGTPVNQLTPEQKAQLYNDMLNTGMSDQQIRNWAEQGYGAQTDTDWNYLQNLAGMQRPIQHFGIDQWGRDANSGFNINTPPAYQQSASQPVGTTQQLFTPFNAQWKGSSTIDPTLLQPVEKAQLYNRMLTSGMTDDQIRQYTNMTVGQQTDEDWNYLKQLAGVQPNRPQGQWSDQLKPPTYSDYTYYTPPAVTPQPLAVSQPATNQTAGNNAGNGGNGGFNSGYAGDPNSLSNGLVGAMFGQDPTNVGVDYSHDTGLGSFGAGYGPADLAGFDAGTGGFGTGSNDPGPSGTGNQGNDADGWAKGGLIGLARKHKVKFADGGLNDLEDTPTDMTLNYGRRSGAVPESQLGLDLSRVTPEQMSILMAQDPEAVQRGAARFTQYTGIPQDVTLPPQPEQGVQALLTKYMVPSDDDTYRAELTAARQQASKETQAFNDLIARAMEQKTEGPSKAEMYFKLAAAFGAPTRTGAFGENLAKASEVMGEHSKAVREAAQADAANKLKLGITSQQARMEAAKTDLTNLRQLAGEEMKDKRAMATELVKQQLAAGKPQSEAGKKAMDMGLTPGTPQYQRFVTNYVEEQLQSGNMFKEAMLAISQQGLQLRQQAEQRQVEAAKKLTPGELKLKTETEDALSATGNVVNDLKEAYRLNPNTFDNSLPDLAMRKSLEAVGSNDPKVVNTRLQENLLTGQALAGLRAAFGGNPTEGERAILLQVQGIGAKSKDERAAIIKRAYTMAKAARERHAKRLQDINAGVYRETTPSPNVDTGGLE